MSIQENIKTGIKNYLVNWLLVHVIGGLIIACLIIFTLELSLHMGISPIVDIILVISCFVGVFFSIPSYCILHRREDYLKLFYSATTGALVFSLPTVIFEKYALFLPFFGACIGYWIGLFLYITFVSIRDKIKGNLNSGNK